MAAHLSKRVTLTPNCGRFDLVELGHVDMGILLSDLIELLSLQVA